MTAEEAKELERMLLALPDRIAEGVGRALRQQTATPALQGAAGGMAGNADLYGATQGLAGAVGNFLPGFSRIAQTMGQVRQLVEAVETFAGLFGSGEQVAEQTPEERLAEARQRYGVRQDFLEYIETLGKPESVAALPPDVPEATAVHEFPLAPGTEAPAFAVPETHAPVVSDEEPPRELPAPTREELMTDEEKQLQTDWTKYVQQRDEESQPSLPRRGLLVEDEEWQANLPQQLRRPGWQPPPEPPIPEEEDAGLRHPLFAGLKGEPAFAFGEMAAMGGGKSGLEEAVAAANEPQEIEAISEAAEKFVGVVDKLDQAVTKLDRMISVKEKPAVAEAAKKPTGKTGLSGQPPEKGDRQTDSGLITFARTAINIGKAVASATG